MAQAEAPPLARWPRRLRALAAWVGRALLWPPALGALYLLALTALAESQPLVSEYERVLGDDSSKLSAWVNVRFAWVIREVTWQLALLAIVVGATLGAFSMGLLGLRRRVLGRGPPSWWAWTAGCAALLVALHAALMMWSVAAHPQFYAAALHEQGGLRRELQLWLTDRLGASVLVWVGPLVALATLSPWRWGAALRRAPRWLAAGAGAGAFLLLLAALGPWRSPAPPRALQRRPNVLILGADSFRNDAFNARVMPHLHALSARRGTRFTRAYVEIARTFPSWVTMLTGRRSARHGIRSMLPRREEREGRSFDSLPERLTRAGYATGVVSDYGGDLFSALDLGFQHRDVPRVNFPEVIRTRGFARALPLLPLLHSRLGRRLLPSFREMQQAADPAMLAADAAAVLDKLPSPFFLTVFFSAAHFPYAAPAPYFSRFTDPAYRGPYKYHKPLWLDGHEKPGGADAAQLRGLYEGALAAVDDAAARLLDEVARRGELDNTIVVILGDHGEHLIDQGRLQGHGGHLFGDQDLHIPLVIIDPRRPDPREETALVQNADLAPTLYDLLGEPPPGDLDGISLAPSLEGRSPPHRPTFAETELWIGAQPSIPEDLRLPCPSMIDFAEIDPHDHEVVLKRSAWGITTAARHRMAFDGQWKLLYAPTARGVRYLLFDTANDPENRHDVAAENPAQVDRLKALLWAWMLGDPLMEERSGFLLPRGEKISPIDDPAPP